MICVDIVCYGRSTVDFGGDAADAVEQFKGVLIFCQAKSLALSEKGSISAALHAHRKRLNTP